MECATKSIFQSPVHWASDSQNSERVLDQAMVSWGQYEVALLGCALKVYSGNWEPDAIVSLGPDGFYFGDALSRLLKKTVGVIMTSQGFGDNLQDPLMAGKLSIALKNELQGKVLLVNSLGRDGLAEMVPMLQENYNGITEVKTMTVYTQTAQTFFLPTSVFNRFDLTKIPQDLLAQISESHYPVLAKKMLQELSSNPSEMLKQDNYVDLPLEVFNQAPCTIDNSQPVPKHMNVTWNDYEVAFLSLALKIYRDGMPDSILCIGRGGLYVGEALSKLFKKTLGVTMASSYSDEEHTQKSILVIAENISIVKPLHGRVLVIDDLVDTGSTLLQIVAMIKEQHQEITDVKTAVVFRKTQTKFSPDYFGDEVDAGRWIFLSNEVFDRFNLSLLSKDLVAKLSDEQLLTLAQKMMVALPECPADNLSTDDHHRLALEVASR